MSRERELLERAQELRAVATFMRLPGTKASILSMADLYERLAEEAREPVPASFGGGD